MAGTYTKKHQQYYRQNKEECLKRMKKYRKKHHKEILNYMRKYNEKTREKNRKYMREYYHKHKIERQQYRKENKELYRLWYRNKRKLDINYRLAHNLRRRLRGLLNGTYKTSSVLILLDCSLEDLKKYLQKQFKSGMNWKNYGKIWEIDHIIPCCKFDLNKPKEQYKCFHYTNLQPLTIYENRSKHGL